MCCAFSFYIFLFAGGCMSVTQLINYETVKIVGFREENK